MPVPRTYVQPELIPAHDPQPSVKEDALAPITPMSLLREAIANKYDMTQLKELFEMAKEWRRLDAEAAFNRDFTAFKKGKPEILKNKTGKMQGQSKSSGKEYSFEYAYADLFEVADKVADALADHGIAHTYESASKLIPVKDSFIERIAVTCLLKHKDGHTHRGATLEGPPDKSGAKNEVQAILSGSSYLERKTLLMTTGCAPQDMDHDGNEKQAAGNGLDDRARIEYLQTIKEAASADELQRVFQSAYKAASSAGDEHAQDEFVKAKDDRKKELRYGNNR